MNQQSEEHSIAGILLAAGAATRMGQPKLLLPWQGEPLIRHAARIALDAGLNPVVVVTGAEQTIAAVLKDLPLQIVDNPDWQSGQSTSVRVGIQALPAETQAAIFLLGDQPFVTTDLIQQLIDTYRKTRPIILAPFVNNKRTNPVLFDRSVFNLLCQLHGDQGGRTLFDQYPPARMQWLDERLLLDIDTPEEYENLISKVG